MAVGLTFAASAQTVIIDPQPIPPVVPDPDSPQPRRVRPVRPPRPARDMAMQVRKQHVEVSIVDGVAVTGVDQVFFNPHNATVEGTYIFPLDDDVALSKFTMFVNGVEIEGKLLGVEEARRTYESIVAKMRDPALLEYVGTRMFQARIFPINPKSEVRVRLAYTQMLETSGGLVRYRYPLNVEKHMAGAVDDLSIVVNLKSAVGIKSVFSPSHKVSVSRASDYRASASYEAQNAHADKDFELVYGLSDKEFGLTVLTHRQAGQDGFFLARISPPAKATDVLPKDISFVVDTSGSMSGEKIRQAQEALNFCLANLNPQDRFNVIAFSHEAVPFETGLTPAVPENLEKARQFVNRLDATGGTNINDAILSALGAAPSGVASRPYLIVFLADGQPTVGVTDPEEILKNVAAGNAKRVRLFVFGVGHDVNTRLLDLMAEQNRGARDYVEPGENLELKLSGFYRKVADPVLADLVLTYGGLSTHDCFPPKLGDLFGGSELIVVGRYNGAGARAIELTGNRRGVAEQFVYETTFPSEDQTNEFLPRLWATRKVGYLLDQIRLHGENAELRATVVALATKYGIVTPYTSYLVTEPGEVAVNRSGFADDGRLFRRSKMATRGSEMPAPGGGWAEVSGVTSPAVDVARSVQASRLQEADAADGLSDSAKEESGESRVSHVGTRTFRRIGERWVDTDYDEKSETVKVELFSAEYFKLIRDHNELAKCFALGDRVVVVLNGVAYETVPSP